MAFNQHGDNRPQLAVTSQIESFHSLSSNSSASCPGESIAPVYSRSLSTGSIQEQDLRFGSLPSLNTDFSGYEFEFNPPTQSYAQALENSYFIHPGFMEHDNSLATGLVPQSPLYIPSSSFSAPFSGPFSTEVEDPYFLSSGQAYPNRVSSDAPISNFGNPWDQPHFEYSRERVQEILDGLPFSPSGPSYEIVPQPTSSDLAHLAANARPSSPHLSNSSVRHPFHFDFTPYYPPASSIDLTLDPSMIHNPTSPLIISGPLLPKPLVLQSHSSTNPEDKEDVRHVEVRRATKTGRARSESTGNVSSSSSSEEQRTEDEDTYVDDGDDEDEDEDEDGEEYQPSPSKRRRTVASTAPSVSRTTRVPATIRSSPTSLSSRQKPQPHKPRKSRTARLATDHPSGYHLDGTGCSDIHQWLRVYFAASKTKESLTNCAFCGVFDGGLPRHVLSNANHGVDWMLGILDETLCGSLLLDALNFTVIWAETNRGPLSKDEAAEQDMLLRQYCHRSSHTVQALHFGDNPFRKLYQIAQDWARRTDATAHRCSCNMKATLRKDVLLRHLRKSRKCHALQKVP